MGVPAQSTLAGAMRRAAGEAGVALASAMFGLVAVSLLITGVFVLTDLQSRAGMNRERATRALHVAEAGLTHTMATLRPYGSSSRTRASRGCCSGSTTPPPRRTTAT